MIEMLSLIFLIVGLVMAVLSAVVAGVLCFVLNGIFAGAINITVLNYGIIEVLLILGVSVVVAVIATILPVYLAAKKPPSGFIRSGADFILMCG